MNSREENSPAAPAEIQTRNFRSRVRRSYQQAIPISTKWVSDSNRQLGPFGSCWEGCYIWESGINDTVSKVKWPRDSRPDIHRLVSGTKEIPCSILIRPRTRRCSFWSLNLAARGSGMSRATRVSPKPYSSRQKKCWVDNIKEWTYLPMPELLTRASCKKSGRGFSSFVAPTIASTCILSCLTFDL